MTSLPSQSLNADFFVVVVFTELKLVKVFNIMGQGWGERVEERRQKEIKIRKERTLDKSGPGTPIRRLWGPLQKEDS